MTTWRPHPHIRVVAIGLHWRDGRLLAAEVRDDAGRIKGVPQSQKLHVVERFTRIGPDEIQYEVTIDDPDYYTQPWKVAVPLERDPGLAG